MPNITLADLTGRGYHVDAFQKRVVCTGVKDDWWILQENWHRLLRDLTAVGSARKKPTLLIDGVDKDFPAHDRARFPGQEPGGPRNFVRVSGKAKSTLQWLASEVNQGNSGSQRWRLCKCVFSWCWCWGCDGREKKRRLREAGLCYGEAVARVASTQLPLYTRSVFETEFDLVWTY